MKIIKFLPLFASFLILPPALNADLILKGDSGASLLDISNYYASANMVSNISSYVHDGNRVAFYMIEESTPSETMPGYDYKYPWIGIGEFTGVETGCSPLEISYTVDCAALKMQAGADAKIVTTISYMPSAAGDADAAAYALREAECAIDGVAAAAECVGEGFGCRLTFVAGPELAEDGLFTYTAAVELGWTEKVCALFAANAEGVLNIQAYAQRV